MDRATHEKEILERIKQSRADLKAAQPQPVVLLSHALAAAAEQNGGPIDLADEELVGRLQQAGKTLDEILAVLSAPAPEADEPEEHAYVPAGKTAREVSRDES